MKTGALTSRDFIAALREQPHSNVESFVTTVEQTKEAVDVAIRPSVFERGLNRLNPDNAAHLPVMLGAYLGAVAEWMVRGHGAMSGQLSSREAHQVLAAGYDKLEGLEKQVVGHMLSRVVLGADSSVPVNRFGYDEKSTARFAKLRDQFAALPIEQRARIDRLADQIQGALSLAALVIQGYRTPEEARALLAEPRQSSSIDPEIQQHPLPRDEAQAISDYALRVFDVTYAHARAQQQHDRLFTQGR